jgi:hypothetical protein
MPKASKSRPPERKVAKTCRLTPSKLKAAQRILGTTTTTETIETALDTVVFREELLRGTRAIRGMDIEPSD